MDTLYDARGQVQKKSRPYFEDRFPRWHSVEYDITGRITKEISPDGSYTRMVYEGLTVCTHNDAGQLNYHTKDVVGNLVKVTDALNNATHYRYDPFNNLVEVEDAAGNITSNSFDIRGRKIAMNDPAMGAWSYQYNVLGELVSQSDAKNQTVTMEYDLLGRMVKRTENEGISRWIYDSAAGGIGKLHSVTGAAGDEKTVQYDALGRETSSTARIDGAAYIISTSFDAYGRVASTIYPASIHAPSGFKVDYVYNAQGYLSELRDSAAGTLLWRAESLNAEGALNQATYGNGVETSRWINADTGLLDSVYSSAAAGLVDIQDDFYSFDTIGNLVMRESRVHNVMENFTYDDLNRLTRSEIGGAVKHYSYDALGNITYKTGIGSYIYDSARPHAVASAGGKTMQYDANGNMVQGWNFTAGQARSQQWTSYNKPSRITQGTTQLDFFYGADRARFKQVNSNGKTTLYVGGLYEKEITATEITHVHFIRAGGDTVAIYKTKETPGGQSGGAETRYLHKDHIGSITAITDEQGQVVEQFAYDPHGKRRVAFDWSDTPVQIYAFETKRSFTGHEYLDDVGLIHMNGRVYDPDLGRFLSPDPIVQQSDNPQNLNRYSYVLNNPLSATDPSGFLFGFLKKVVKGIARAVKKVVKAIAQSAIGQAIVQIGAYFACGGGVSGAGCAAAVSGAFTAVNGGSVGDVIKSAAVTFASAYAVSNIEGGISSIHLKTLAHGAVGGLSSVANGGKFLRGFISSGGGGFFGGSTFVNGLGSIGQGISRAIAGGLNSVVSGGKFANGATTAAFAHLFSGAGGTKKQQASSSSGGGFFDGVLDVVGKIWALPNTIIGLAYGGAGMLFGATPVWDSAAGILRFTNMPEWMMPTAMSLGHVQVFGPGSYKNPDGTYALNRFGVSIVREETLHTRQAEILGPLYLPLHGLSMGESLLTGGGTHSNNLLEYGPERGSGAWPWS